MRIVELSLVEINKHAFVRNNPNYLFSGKKLRTICKSNYEFSKKETY